LKSTERENTTSRGVGRDTPLLRKPGLRLELFGDGSVDVTDADQKIRLGRYTLAILDAFAQPATMREALASLNFKSPLAWAEAATTVITLQKAGLLLSPGDTVGAPDRGFGVAAVHVGMLNDKARVETYIKAIQQSVRPNDVVVDIGTGTGILALAAAKAGARRVFAIEGGPMADVAQAVFAGSEGGDRIELIRGWSTKVELPERASLLVSELIGNDPLGENVLAVVTDARQRLLRPDARHLPDRLRVCALPVTIPQAHLARHAVTKENLDNWRSWYGMDLSPLSRMEHTQLRPLFHIRPQEAQSWQVLAPPLILADLPMCHFTGRPMRTRFETVLHATGTLNGLLIYFELGLGVTTLSTHPACASASNHWRSPVYWIRENPVGQIGATAAFEVCHKSRGWELQLIGLRPAQS